MSNSDFSRRPASRPPTPAIDAANVRLAAGSVADPCGLLYGNGLTFGELGMVDEVEVADRTVTVRLLLDDPNCLYMPQIIQGIEDAVLGLDGVEEVVVKNRGNEIWTRDRMSTEGREKYQRHLVAKQERIELRLSNRTGSPNRETTQILLTQGNEIGGGK